MTMSMENCYFDLLRYISMLLQLDSWCVILNGSVEVLVPGEESMTLHLGDSFGVEPTLKKMRHRGVMKTRVDDCQVRLISLMSLVIHV